MANSFLFIIPLTPQALLSPGRKALRKLCFDTLAGQEYKHWEALVIGDAGADETGYKNFTHLNYEGAKEEKLQVATQYIRNAEKKPDYIIRLDDDDVFNPGILEQLGHKDFDLYVDKYHSFWDLSTGLIAQKIMYWFPNTCILKSGHALSVFGKFPHGEYRRFNDKPLLVENEHSDFHFYFNQSHKIIYAAKDSPLYLRAVNPGSITALEATDYSKYMNGFGYWKKNNLLSFSFLMATNVGKPYKKTVKQGLGFFLRSVKNTVLSLKNYNKLVINKNTAI